MAGFFQLANKLVLRALGRSLDWTEHADGANAAFASQPTGNSDGVNLSNSPTCMVAIEASAAATVQLHGQCLVDGSYRWYAIDDAEYDITSEGFLQRFDVAGVRNLAVVLVSGTQPDTIYIGPAEDESA